jgi:predicted dehydrogenase
MDTKDRIRVVIVGCGSMARSHVRSMLRQQDTTQIAITCEPAPEAYAATSDVFTAAGVEPPPNEPDLKRLLSDFGDQLDAALIATPHVYHHDQAKACLEAGLDVLLEKPMVMNAAEALSLIDARDGTGGLLVVAFNGSLSPQIRTAVDLLRSGKMGAVLSINAVVWQSWGPGTVGRWRQQPEISGGGFLFDTGAHMLNTVADLAGEDFVEVAAWLDDRRRPVDVLASVMGRLESGVMVTLHGCGETIPSCSSDIRVFCSKAIVCTDAWGRWLKVQRYGRKRFRTVKVPPSLGAWEQFLAVRNGEMPNPCPPEVGLRMARLWDAIKASAQQNGAPVQCEIGG